MRKLLALTALVSNLALADPELNLTATVKNHGGNTAGGTYVTSFHAFNINNNTGSRKFYRLAWCLEIANGAPLCRTDHVELKSGQWHRDHWTLELTSRKLEKGTYPIVATTKVNETIVESRAELSVT